jgi:hypothetical protein
MNKANQSSKQWDKTISKMEKLRKEDADCLADMFHRFDDDLPISEFVDSLVNYIRSKK